MKWSIIQCGFLIFALAGGSPALSHGRQSNPNRIKDRKITFLASGLHGYIGCETVATPARKNFSMGISFYTAIWPLVHQPLANFQVGLAGTWITPDNSDDKDVPLDPPGTLARQWKERGPTWDTVFQTIEGSAGYWAGNQFRYGSPKFSMNGTPEAYDYEVGSPGWSFFYGPKALPDNRLGLAQLSNRILVPPDGFTFAGHPDGKFLGYAWMALPLTKKSFSTYPTGDESWTCFLNTTNFKGPIAFYIPETWSKFGKIFNDPYLYGRGLDARPGDIGGGFAMEVNTVPAFTMRGSNGAIYAKIPELQFPVDANGETRIIQDVTYYSKGALFNAMKKWRDGGNSSSGVFDQNHGWRPKLSTYKVQYDQNGKSIQGVTKYFNTRVYDGNIWGLKWTQNGILSKGQFPQYFKQVGNKCIVVPASEVPSALRKKQFPLARPGVPYTSPNRGAWAHPGPVSKRYTTVLADGSTVTYRWYRFIDQPAFQQYHWSERKKAALQSLIEQIQSSWPINRSYMPPPTTGKLVTIDPGLIVRPPKGMEIGYVPIVVGQEKN